MTDGEEASVLDPEPPVQIEVVTLTHEFWGLALQAFDERARVIRLDVSGTAVPVHLDEPVGSFIWPQPASACEVTVAQPDLESFQKRLAPLLPSAENPDEDGNAFSPEIFIEDQSMNVNTGFPGSVSDVPCPQCDTLSPLVFEDVRTVDRAAKSLADNMGKPYYFKACEAHGGHAYIGGHEATVLRCPSCLILFLHTDELRTFSLMLQDG